MNLPECKHITLGWDGLVDIMFTSPTVLVDSTVLIGAMPVGQHREPHRVTCPWQDGGHSWPFDDGCRLTLRLVKA